jgi:hypothetical protein
MFIVRYLASNNNLRKMSQISYNYPITQFIKVFLVSRRDGACLIQGGKYDTIATFIYPHISGFCNLDFWRAKIIIKKSVKL